MKRGRTPCCDKVGLKKGPWTPQEDKNLIAYVQQHGHGNWRSLPPKAGLERCGKSCRMRWINYLRPDIKRGNFSMDEDRTIIQLHALLGNKWSRIAAQLHKRTDNEIKNYWNSNLKKRLIKMGIDPITHKPKSANNTVDNNCSNDIAANMSHMAQWESARLQAEARESTLRVGSSSSSSHPTARLILSKIPPRPSPPPCLDVLKAWQSLGSIESSSSPSTKHNNTMYNMYAIMLATTDDHDLHSPVSTLSFQECKLPNVGNNNIDTATTREGIDVSSLQDDGDIMVAVEAFRAASAARGDENIPELISNGAMDGLNNDTAPVFEGFAEEYGRRSFDSEAGFQDWNSSILLNLDYHSRNY